MSDRRGAEPPRDVDGEPLIDGAVVRKMLGMTSAGARRCIERNGVRVIRKGAHGSSLYRLADILAVLDKRDQAGII